MPHHPTNRLAYNDRILLEDLDGATHVEIRCRCAHQQIWRTAVLIERCPRAVTIRDFVERLRCSKCNLRGWCLISAIPRR